MLVRKTLSLLCGLCAVFWLNPDLSHSTGLTTSDRVALLYSSQLQFSAAGDPLIKIGLMDGLEQFDFTVDAPTRVLPLGDGGPEVTFPANTQFRLRRIDGQPGVYRYSILVARLFENNRAELANARELWTARGFQPQVHNLGSFFAVQGVTFDNRQWIVVAASSSDRESAMELANQIERDYGITPELHVDLVEFPSGSIELIAPQLGVTVRHRDLLWMTTTAEGRFDIEGSAFNTESSRTDEANRQFVGSLIVTFDRRGLLSLVNEVAVERLIEGILPAEIYASAPMAALEAQAVAARSEILANLGVRYLADPYMTCADQRCQVYRGVGAEHPRTSRATAASRGRVLMWRNRIAQTVYSASNGGSAGDYASTWGFEPMDYLSYRFDCFDLDERFREGLNESNVRAFLTARPDCFCNIQHYGGSNTFRWQVDYTHQQLTDHVNSRHSVGRVRDLEVLARDPSGRVTQLRIVGSNREVVVERELSIRRALGGLRSALFVMDISRDAAGNISSLTFSGGGFGHGVGLCQTGAIGAAERGLGYDEILQHYYPGTSIQRLWE